MQIRSYLLRIVILFVLLVPRPGRAALTQGAEFLQLERGARAPALGGAVSARANGVLAPQYNPAGLAETNSNQFETSFQSLVEDIQYGNFSWADGQNNTGLGYELIYIDYGSINETTLDENYNVSETGRFSSSEFAAGLFYGSRLLTRPHYRLNWGGGFRFIHSTINNSARALAFTGGLQLITTDENLMAGGVIRNLGNKLEYENGSSAASLPTDYRLAVAYKLLAERNSPNSLWAYYELNMRQAGQNDLGYSAGLEFTHRNKFVFRAGYNQRREIDNGFSAGLGVTHEALTFDYAIIPYGEFGTSHRLALKFDI
ncbi:MAG: PorV/PorQ family protein [bacterium]